MEVKDHEYDDIPSIHPPSLVRLNIDPHPPSPLASAPTTPLRVTNMEGDDDLEGGRRAKQQRNTTNLFSGSVHTSYTPFDEPDDGNASSPATQSLLFESRRGRITSASSLDAVYRARNPNSSSLQTRLSSPKAEKNKEKEVSIQENDFIVVKGTPSTLRMMALLKRESQPTSTVPGMSPDMLTTRQFARTYVPTIIAPTVASSLDTAKPSAMPLVMNTLDDDDDDYYAPDDEKSRKSDILSHDSPTQSTKQLPLALALIPSEDMTHTAQPVTAPECPATSEKIISFTTPQHQDKSHNAGVLTFFPSQAVQEGDNSGELEVQLNSDEEYCDEEEDDEEEDVIDLLMSDAAYFSNAAANMTFSLSSVLADAGAVMEQLVLGPPKAVKSPEQIAAEWRRRKRLAVMESKTYATEPVPNMAVSEVVTEEVEVTSNGISIDNEDDLTTVADNRVRSNLDDIPEDTSVANVLKTRSEGGHAVGDGNFDAKTTVKPNGMNSVTGWWKDKELVRRGNSVTSSDSAPSIVSLLSSRDDLSEITVDSSHKQRKKRFAGNQPIPLPGFDGEYFAIPSTVTMTTNDSDTTSSRRKDQYLDQEVAKSQPLEVNSLTKLLKDDDKVDNEEAHIYHKQGVTMASNGKHRERPWEHGWKERSDKGKIKINSFPDEEKKDELVAKEFESDAALSDSGRIDAIDAHSLEANPVYRPPPMLLRTPIDCGDLPSLSRIGLPDEASFHATSLETCKYTESSGNDGSQMPALTTEDSSEIKIASDTLREESYPGESPTFGVLAKGKATGDITPEIPERNGNSNENLGCARTREIATAIGNTESIPRKEGDLEHTPSIIIHTFTKTVVPTLCEPTLDSCERVPSVNETSKAIDVCMDAAGLPQMTNDVFVGTKSPGDSSNFVSSRPTDLQDRSCGGDLASQSTMYKEVDTLVIETNKNGEHGKKGGRPGGIHASVHESESNVPTRNVVSETMSSAATDQSAIVSESKSIDYHYSAGTNEQKTGIHTNGAAFSSTQSAIYNMRNVSIERAHQVKAIDPALACLIEEEEKKDFCFNDEIANSVCEQRSDCDPRAIVTASSDEISAGVTSMAVQTVNTSSSEMTARLSNATPVMIKSIDDQYGIARGDVVLSLVKTTSEASGTTGRGQVRNAVWRMRTMRRRMISREQEKPLAKTEKQVGTNNGGSPSRRSSLPVDVDDVRVIGGIKKIETLQAHALEHLQVDEIDEAQELYEDIIYAYTETFLEREKAKAIAKSGDDDAGLDFRPYIGTALHNLGLLHFLSGDFTDALSFFVRARDSRKTVLGESHADYLTSYIKAALCHYALDHFDIAHVELETALSLCKANCKNVSDFMQIAEILNNLGVLSFMCGDPGASLYHFKESLEVQQAVLSHSLYNLGTISTHGITLNISVTRGNVGFVKLVQKKLPAALVAFESALMHQQMLLNDSHETLIGSMDHLAVVNSLLGDKTKALKMLSRMLEAQVAAHGRNDPRCESTLSKLRLIEDKEKNVAEAVDQMSKSHAPARPSLEHSRSLSASSAILQKTDSPRVPLVSKPSLLSASTKRAKSASVLQRLISKRKQKDEPTADIVRIEI